MSNKMGTYGRYHLNPNPKVPPLRPRDSTSVEKRPDLCVQSSRNNPSGAAPSQRYERSESLWSDPTFDHPRGSNERKRATFEADYDEDPESFQLRDSCLTVRIEAERLQQKFVEHDEYELDKMDRPWQIQLRKELQAAPDDRTIHWVYGPDGNEGKSTFVKCLMKKDWVMVNAGAAADMKDQYIQQGMTKNMVVDVPRKVQGVHYSAIYSLVEEVKNRLISSTKYRPGHVVDVGRVHVVVMSNKKPDMEMLSKDRICLHDLSPQSVEVDCGDRPHSR